jgi:hypothetical protein
MKGFLGGDFVIFRPKARGDIEFGVFFVKLIFFKDIIINS